MWSSTSTPIRGSRTRLRCLARPSTVEKTTLPSCSATHTTDCCGVPSALIVVITAKFGPRSSSRHCEVSIMSFLRLPVRVWGNVWLPSRGPCPQHGSEHQEPVALGVARVDNPLCGPGDERPAADPAPHTWEGADPHMLQRRRGEQPAGDALVHEPLAQAEPSLRH